MMELYAQFASSLKKFSKSSIQGKMLFNVLRVSDAALRCEFGKVI